MLLQREGYYEMLVKLSEDGVPATMTLGKACEVMNCSRPHLRELIRKGRIKLSDGKITIGAVARYLCM